MDLMQFVPEQLIILVVSLYVLGMFLKNSPKIQDWTIPWILLLVGIIGSISIQQSFSALPIFQGIVATGCSVLTNQLIKQTTNKE